MSDYDIDYEEEAKMDNLTAAYEGEIDAIDAETKPLKWTLDSFKMDAGDFVLPESDEDWITFVESLRECLDLEEWLNQSDLIRYQASATSLAFYKMRLADVLIKTARYNRLTVTALADILRLRL